MTPDDSDLPGDLPVAVRADFVRRRRDGVPLPATPGECFERLLDWTVEAAADERAGAYAGGGSRHGRAAYIVLQRRLLEHYRALAAQYGEPEATVVDAFSHLAERFPPPVRRLGDGWEPLVEDAAGRLLYWQPVESGLVNATFAFEIAPRDLDVLLSQPYRRAVLEIAGHTLLQPGVSRQDDELTDAAFADLVDRTLHSTDADLAAFVTAFDAVHAIGIEHFAREAMTRRASRPIDAG